MKKIVIKYNPNHMDEPADDRYLLDPDLLADLSNYPFTPELSEAYRYDKTRLGEMNALFDLQACQNWCRERDGLVNVALLEV